MLRLRLWRCSYLTLIVALGSTGCGRSTVHYPKAPKIRIEGPAGAAVGYSLTYFDGNEALDLTATIKFIPASGVYTEDLQAGHTGLHLAVAPQGKDDVTVVLLDDAKELLRSTARGNKGTAQVQAGKVTLSALAPR